MSTEQPWSVDPADEARHRPDAAELWNESYYLDVVDASGKVGGYVRLGFYPNMQVAWWTTALVVEGEETVLSVAYDLDVPEGDSLEASGTSTSISIFIRPSTSPQTSAVAAGFAAPQNSPKIGARVSKSAPSVR